MLKQEFETICMKFRASAFAKFSQLITDKKYGKMTVASNHTNTRTFLQVELLERVEQANYDRPVTAHLVLPPFITPDQLNTITSVMKNDLI